MHRFVGAILLVGAHLPRSPPAFLRDNDERRAGTGFGERCVVRGVGLEIARQRVMVSCTGKGSRVL